MIHLSDGCSCTICAAIGDGASGSEIVEAMATMLFGDLPMEGGFFPTDPDDPLGDEDEDPEDIDFGDDEFTDDEDG